MPHNIQPLYDFIAIQMDPAETASPGGIVLVPTKQDNTSQQGTAIAVGPGVVVDGKREAPTVKVGDRVLFNRGTGATVEVDKEKYLFIRERDLMGIIR